jgi:hypothetical protein
MPKDWPVPENEVSTVYREAEMNEKPEKDSPIAKENAVGEPEKKQTRRAMFAKLGLAAAAVYAAPVLFTLNDAEARSRSRSGSRRKKRRNRKKRNNRRNRSRSRSRSRSRD